MFKFSKLISLFMFLALSSAVNSQSPAVNSQSPSGTLKAAASAKTKARVGTGANGYGHGWRLEKTKDELDGTESQSITQTSASTIRVGAGRTSLVALLFRCNERAADGEVFSALVLPAGFDLAAHGDGDPGPGRGWTDVRFRFSKWGGHPSAVSADSWGTGKTWAAPFGNRADFLQEAIHYDGLKIEFTPYGSSAQVAAFDLRGLTRALEKMTACHVH
jgi:hypothetical protein